MKITQSAQVVSPVTEEGTGASIQVFQSEPLTVQFSPYLAQQIDPENFVDLTSVAATEQHGLKMMLFINEENQLCLLSGQNRGFIRSVTKDQCQPSHTYAPLPIENKQFTALWVNDSQQLSVQYIDECNVHRVAQLQLNAKPFNSSLLSERASDQRLKLEPCFSDIRLASEGEAVQTDVLFANGVRKSVTLTKDNELEVNGHKVPIPFLSSDRTITAIKTCGKQLQLSFNDNKRDKKFVCYVDFQHIDISGKCYEPVFSNLPPAAFSHFAANNKSHYSNANPFVSDQFERIGNRYFPLASWIDGIKHRVHAGDEKLVRGRTGAAILSYLKAPDPGFITVGKSIGRLIFDREPRLSPEAKVLEQELDKRLNPTSDQLLTEWKESLSLGASSCVSIDKSLKDTVSRYHLPSMDSFCEVAEEALGLDFDMGKVTNAEEVTGEVHPKLSIDLLPGDCIALPKPLHLQLDCALTSTLHLEPLFSKLDFDPSKDDKSVRQQMFWLKQQLEDILRHPQAGKLSPEELTMLMQLKPILEKGCTKGSAPLRMKDIELYFPFVQNTFANIRVCLAAHRTVTVNKALIEHQAESFDEKPLEAAEAKWLKSDTFVEVTSFDKVALDALERKVLDEQQLKLMQSVKQGLLSVNAFDLSQKTHAKIKASLDDTHTGLGKTWSTANEQPSPAPKITQALAEQVLQMPKGDSMRLSTELKTKAFIGAAKPSLPFTADLGFFAGIAGSYQKCYDLSLSRKDKEEVILTFHRKSSSSVDLMAGSGQGWSNLTQILTYKDGNTFTCLQPLEIIFLLGAMKSSDQDFTFNIKADQLEKTLDYLNGTVDWDQEICEAMSDPQYESLICNKTEASLWTDSDMRIQFASSQSPTVATTFPRQFLRLRLQAGVGVEDVRQVDIGATSSQITEETKGYAYAKAAVIHGAWGHIAQDNDGVLMLLQLEDEATSCHLLAGQRVESVLSKQSTHGPSDEIPNILERTKAESSAAFQAVISSSNEENSWNPPHQIELSLPEDLQIKDLRSANEKDKASGVMKAVDITSLSPSSEMPQNLQQILSLANLLKDIESSNLPQKIKDKSKANVEALIKALDRGYLDYSQTLAASDLEEVYLSRVINVTWYQRLADQLRRLFSMEPKYSKNLGQFMQSYPQGKQLIKDMEESGKSQSQMLNLGSTSRLNALAHYRIEKEQLNKIAEGYIHDMALSLTREEFDATECLNRNLSALIAVKSRADRAQYRLHQVDFSRVSMLSRNPPGLFPFLQFANQVAITSTEHLGHLNFSYDASNEEGLPSEVKNHVQGALMSVVRHSACPKHFV